MTRVRAIVVAACLCLCFFGSSVSQPTSCHLLDHCSDGYYCDSDLLICRKCLSCEDLNREPRDSQSSCIKSVAECGPCNKGLVEDRGNANAQCVSPGARGDDDGFPLYGWVLVGLLGLLVLLLVFSIVWYVLKHPDTLKIMASTSTSMQSRCDRTVVPTSAPENPPPYNALYSPVQPTAPSTLPQPDSSYSTPFNQESDGQHNDEESSSPFIKHPSPDRVWSACETAGNQAARIYENPAYTRGAPVPNGYDNGVPPSIRGPELEAHDEETIESSWTPTESPGENDNNANFPSAVAAAGEDDSGDLTARLAAAKRTTLIRTPHPEVVTQPCVRQASDPNNNGNRGSGEGGGAFNAATAGSSFIINVVQTINTLQQRGDAQH